MAVDRLRVKFLWAWWLLLLAKLALAVRLPAMTDEAFYAWEGRHLAWAYSDIPGLTAWLARLGLELAGHSAFAIRIPSILLGAALPWLLWRIAGRWFGAQAGLWAGLLCLLMPLAGLLGLLALPDVPLVLASFICLDAIAMLRERISRPALAWLALGLAMGALSHYRFAMVLLAGACGLLLDARSRHLFREPGFWLVLLLGTMAWWPLLQWNLEHGGAGLRFHLLDRNPWTWDVSGLDWLWRQALLVTPLLFLSLLAVQPRAWRRARDEPDGPWRLLVAVGAVATWGWFIAGFFADRERVSFHWPLTGWLAWVVVLAAGMDRLSRGWRIAIVAMAAMGQVATLAILFLASDPGWRRSSAGDRWYPDSFAGIHEAMGELRRQAPPIGTVLVADNFALAAQLALAMPAHEVRVLEHPLNHKHGRAAQLDSWQLRLVSRRELGGRPLLLVVDDSAVVPADRLAAYRRLCRAMSGLPEPRLLPVDHGRRRYLFYRYEAGAPARDCVLPAMAWMDAPAKDARVRSSRLVVRGWAAKEGEGVAGVDILVDGRMAARARYGLAMPHVADYWQGLADPGLPDVGFRAEVDMSRLPAGPYWLGLRIHGRGGGVESLPEQRFFVEGPGQ